MVWKAQAQLMGSLSGMICRLLIILRISPEGSTMTLEFYSTLRFTPKKGNQQPSEIKGRINKTFLSVYHQIKDLSGSMVQLLWLSHNQGFVESESKSAFNE